jgi:hypothetical protein
VVASHIRFIIQTRFSGIRPVSDICYRRNLYNIYITIIYVQCDSNACCHSVQKILSSHLLSKNVKLRIYKTIILPVVRYGCETQSLTLREQLRLRMFENRVVRKIFGSKRD